MAIQERRKHQRVSLDVPVRVQGHDADGTPWDEMTSSADASAGGASFRLTRPVNLGQVLFLSLPLPRSLRRYDLTQASYRVYGLVRDAAPDPGKPRIGVMFLGRHPPRGFEAEPGGRFLLASDPTPPARERRRYRRLALFVNLKLCRRESPEGAAEEEQSVAENLSKRGARVMTSMPVAKGDILQVEELGGTFRTRAEIKNLYIGADGIPRLNLYFIEAETPDRLLPR
jgi:PilZ domain